MADLDIPVIIDVDATAVVTTPTTNVTRFRFRNRKVLLTYTGHIAKEEYKNWFSEAIIAETKVLEMAHETGKQTGLLHTHVLIEFAAAFSTENSRKFDYTWLNEVRHPNIKPIKTDIHWKRCRSYLAKEDPENQHLLLLEKSLVERVLEYPTKLEMLKEECVRPSDVMGLCMLYNMRKEPPLKLHFDPRPWQAEILAYLSGPACPRKVVWVYDGPGNSGKTYLGKYVLRTDTGYRYVDRIDGSRNFSNLIQEFIEGGWEKKGLFINLTRDSEALKIYGAIETVKDGFATNTKYFCKAIDITRPKGDFQQEQHVHMIVFANFMPDTSKLSKDRWMIKEIYDGYNMHDVSIESAEKIRLKAIVDRGVAEKLRVEEMSREAGFDCRMFYHSTMTL